MKKTIVTWDLGATKCAAAIVEFDSKSQKFTCKKSYVSKVASHASLRELIEDLEMNLEIQMRAADAICIGAAGNYDGENLILESGYPYAMPFAKIAREQEWPSFAVVHDYVPIICATFTDYMHESSNVKYLNQQPMDKYQRRVALGLGTGLGLKDGILFQDGNFWLGHNEIGHIGITTPPTLDVHIQNRHAELIRFFLSENILRSDEPLTFERVLTGQGLVNLYRFCYPQCGVPTPEELGMKLSQGDAGEVYPLFAWYLGLFVGLVQLTFIPMGGIWMTGGVLLHHLSVVDTPEFLQGIRATPSYMAIRKSLPLGVLCDDRHAFFGGAYYAMRRLVS